MSLNTINFSNEGTNINRKTHKVLDQQQIKQYNQGLAEISEELNEDKSKNQQKVDDLKQKLNTLSAKEQLLEKFENGKAVFFALQEEGGEKAIQNRINEFNSYDNYNNNGKEGIQHVAYSVRTKFNDVLSKSDEEVAEIY
ncbi:MAG: hypothetical protein LBG59_09635 [Candidatus Peribacteria bacterium]|jgi:lysyl-tRNA synthetase class II|nr:hypothetical protein [Candidatus Peribacteria bacterium]